MTAAATIRYGLVAAGASLLALYLALLVELDQPYWAATTVLIVAQPVPGQVVGKGFWRAVGTVAGAAAGTALVGAFAQEPELFVAALAGWIAACTGVATVLRGFRSYGAVLSGYTAAIVAMSALASPERTFDIATARGAAILLGIMCGALGAALLLPSRSRAELMQRVSVALADAARLVAEAGFGKASREERRRLVTDLADLERLGSAAAAEDLATRRRLAGLAGVLSELLSVASALRAVDEHLARLDAGARAALLSAAKPAAEDAAIMAGEIMSVGRTHALLPELAAPRDDAGSAFAGAVGLLILRDRLDDALRHLQRAAAARSYLRGETRERPTARISFHRDFGQAGRNALRAALAVALAGGFAIASAWSGGGTFLTNICVACSLFATQPRPSAAAFGFMQGAALAIAAAFAVKFYVLPLLDGFVLLALVTAPVIVAGTAATAVPGWLGTATAFNVLFLSNLSPSNTMSYDPVAFLDGAVATLAAFAVGGTVFRVVLPSDPARAARRLAVLLRADLASLAGGRVRDPERLQSLMYDRVGRITTDAAQPDLAAGSISSLGVAAELVRLRALTLSPGVRDEVARVLDAVAGEGTSRAIVEVAEAALAALPGLPDTDDRTAVARATAGVTAIRDAVVASPRFFDGAAAT